MITTDCPGSVLSSVKRVAVAAVVELHTGVGLVKLKLSDDWSDTPTPTIRHPVGAPTVTGAPLPS